MRRTSGVHFPFRKDAGISRCCRRSALAIPPWLRVPLYHFSIHLLSPGTKLDMFTVCGAAKSINLAGTFADNSGQSVADIQNKIGVALGKLGSTLPAIECD